MCSVERLQLANQWDMNNLLAAEVECGGSAHELKAGLMHTPYSPHMGPKWGVSHS